MKKYLKALFLFIFSFSLFMGVKSVDAMENEISNQIGFYVKFQEGQYVLEDEAYSLFSESEINASIQYLGELNQAIREGYYLIDDESGMATSWSLLFRSAGITGSQIIYDKTFGVLNRIYIKASDLNLLWTGGLTIAGMKFKGWLASIVLAYLGYKTDIQHGIYIDMTLMGNPVGFGQQ